MKICLIAGELSGDLHGSLLMKELKKLGQNLSFIGVGGPRMREEGLSPFFPMEELQVMGFVDVLKALPKLLSLLRQTRKKILQEKPELVLTIDYPGFNLKLASSLKKQNFPGLLCHYISPSVWAWKRGRIALLEKTLDHLLTIFPFEKSYFPHLPVTYVGHPLVEELKNNRLPCKEKTITIFPGSRAKEIERNLPQALTIAKKILEKHPSFQCTISIAHPTLEPLALSILGEHDRKKFTLLKKTDSLHPCSLAIAKSGTITLELALLGIPTVVLYQMSWIDAFLAKYIFRINLPYYCIVNILAQKELFPESFGPSLDLNKLYTKALEWIESPERAPPAQETMLQILGKKSASKEAAATLWKLLVDKQPHSLE